MAHGGLFLTLLNRYHIDVHTDQKFYEPNKIVQWAMVIYDSVWNFSKSAMVRGFLKACGEVGKYSNVYYLAISWHGKS